MKESQTEGKNGETETMTHTLPLERERERGSIPYSYIAIIEVDT